MYFCLLICFSPFASVLCHFLRTVTVHQIFPLLHLSAGNCLMNISLCIKHVPITPKKRQFWVPTVVYSIHACGHDSRSRAVGDTAELCLVTTTRSVIMPEVSLPGLFRALWYFVEGYILHLRRYVSAHVVLPFRKLHFCKTARSCSSSASENPNVLPPSRFGSGSENCHYLLIFSFWLTRIRGWRRGRSSPVVGSTWGILVSLVGCHLLNFRALD